MQVRLIKKLVEMIENRSRRSFAGRISNCVSGKPDYWLPKVWA